MSPHAPAGCTFYTSSSKSHLESELQYRSMTKCPPQWTWRTDTLAPTGYQNQPAIPSSLRTRTSEPLNRGASSEDLSNRVQVNSWFGLETQARGHWTGRRWSWTYPIGTSWRIPSPWVWAAGGSSCDRRGTPTGRSLIEFDSSTGSAVSFFGYCWR